MQRHSSQVTALYRPLSVEELNLVSGGKGKAKGEGAPSDDSHEKKLLNGLTGSMLSDDDHNDDPIVVITPPIDIPDYPDYPDHPYNPDPGGGGGNPLPAIKHVVEFAKTAAEIWKKIDAVKEDKDNVNYEVQAKVTSEYVNGEWSFKAEITLTLKKS